MTGFFTRIARTALSLTPVAKVATGARYAPGPELAMGGMDASSRSDEAAVTRAAAAALSAAKPKARRDAGPPPPVILSEAKDLEMRRPSPPRSFAVSAAQDDVTPVREARPAGGDPETSLGMTPEEIEARAAHTERPPEVIEAPADTQVSPPTVSSRAQSRDSVPVSEMRAVERRSLDFAPGDGVEMPATVHIAEPVPDSGGLKPTAPQGRGETEGVVVETRPSARAPAPAFVPAEPPPPVVHVTIGRVEVRAVSPPAPPVETPAPFAPRISLDEYLGRKR